MNPNQALWEKGGFTRVAQSMRRSGELWVNGIGVTKGLKSLDLGQRVSIPGRLIRPMVIV
jgi:hypothetical protein